jgi:hypothetical protein
VEWEVNRGVPSDFSPQVPFRYGILHDMESIWWIALWCLFMRRPVDDESDPDSQRQTANLIFPRYHSTTDHRSFLFTFAGMWKRNVASLPAAFAPAAHHLALLNLALRSAYSATYKNFMDENTGFISSVAELASDPSGSPVTIHQTSQDKLRDVRDAVHHCKIIYLSFFESVRKRKGDATDQTVGKKPRQVSTTGRAG